MFKKSFAKVMTGRTVWVLGLVGLGLAGVASGQGHRPAATLDELVVEVQGLRAEMNQMAAASIRAQVLVGRLQIEDERMAAVTRQIDTVQADIAADEQTRAEAAGRIKTLENSLASVPGDVREQIERELLALRSTEERASQRREELIQRERALNREFDEGQARWIAINSQIESFEQTLASR